MSTPTYRGDLDKLRDRCEALEDELGRLKEAVQFLVFCKATDPAFAFYNWLVKHDVFDRRRARLEHVLGVLDSRLVGQMPTVRKSVDGIPDQDLYDPSPPTREAARQLLMQALDTRNPAMIDELFQALSTQTPERALAVWWKQLEEPNRG